MSPVAHSIEQSRLEIILLAAGVLVLVLFFGVFILICVSLTHSNSPLSQHRATPWGGRWNDRWDAGPSDGPAPGQDESGFDNVRRRSVSVAEDIRSDLTTLKQLVPLDMPGYDVPRPRYTENTDPTLYSLTTTNDEINYRVAEHMLDEDVSDWHDLLESPASSTGRDREGGTVTKRPERAMIHNDSCDLEAQDSDNSEH